VSRDAGTSRNLIVGRAVALLAEVAVASSGCGGSGSTTAAGCNSASSASSGAGGGLGAPPQDGQSSSTAYTAAIYVPDNASVGGVDWCPGGSFAGTSPREVGPWRVAAFLDWPASAVHLTNRTFSPHPALRESRWGQGHSHARAGHGCGDLPVPVRLRLFERIRAAAGEDLIAGLATRLTLPPAVVLQALQDDAALPVRPTRPPAPTLTGPQRHRRFTPDQRAAVDAMTTADPETLLHDIWVRLVDDHHADVS
jgi:hypothetical protein